MTRLTITRCCCYNWFTQPWRLSLAWMRPPIAFTRLTATGCLPTLVVGWELFHEITFMMKLWQHFRLNSLTNLYCLRWHAACVHQFASDACASTTSLLNRSCSSVFSLVTSVEARRLCFLSLSVCLPVCHSVWLYESPLDYWKSYYFDELLKRWGPRNNWLDFGGEPIMIRILEFFRQYIYLAQCIKSFLFSRWQHKHVLSEWF